MIARRLFQAIEFQSFQSLLMWQQQIAVKNCCWRIRRFIRQPYTYALIALVVASYFVLHAFLRPPTPTLTQYPLQPICAFANAESMETALLTAKQWPQFPIWFSVWRENVEPHTIDGRIHVLPAPGSSHADGWNYAIKAARESKFDCEYFFAMDDDLQWQVTVTARQHYADIAERPMGFIESFYISPTEVLLNFLSTYQPALTVFPWPWGDVAHGNLTLMNNKYQGQLVQPATGFDNGCMIFHRSIIDFFVPVWLGAGHSAKFIIQHTFQNFFAPFLFRGNAIRFNGLRYFNPPKQRHPYESAEKYNKFLLPASKCSHKRWGPYLTPDDVTWDVVVGSPPYTFNDLYNIATFFDISHSAIREHPAINNVYSQSEIVAFEAFAKENLPPAMACTWPDSRNALINSAKHLKLSKLKSSAIVANNKRRRS